MNFKHFLALLFCLSVTLSANAAKATQDLLTRAQSDGTELDFYLRGDEHFHFIETTDGYELVENTNGDFVYALRSEAGEVSPTTQLAHNPADRTATETAFLSSVNKAAEIQNHKIAFDQARAQRAAGLQRARSNAPAVAGSLRVPVLLVEYADVKFTIPSPKTEITNQLNQPGYSNNGHNGSARDYFLDNSFGQFKPIFEVTDVVTLSQPRAYYGRNDSNGDDLRPGTMIAEALWLADASFDFSPYDANGDGKIDVLCVIFADCSEAESNVTTDAIWSHSYYLSILAGHEGFTNPVVDGLRADSYACTSELTRRGGTIKQAGIGTFCHEFCHACFNLHDLYDTDYDKSNGVNPGFGSWCLMDSGDKLNDGRTPPYLTAYERSLLGWGTSAVLEEAGDYTLPPIQNGNYYRITTPNSYEYFLLENRQLSGWDSSLPGHGMLITRVYEEDLYYFNQNRINAVKDQERVNLLEAYGAYRYLENYSVYQSTDTDPFPGSRNITRWDDIVSTSANPLYGTPANSRLWDGSALRKPVFDISEQSGIISFTFIEKINPFIISRSGNTLTIESKIDLKQISVYNLLGQLLHQQAGHRGENTLQLPTGNIYLLKLDGKTLKIAM